MVKSPAASVQPPVPTLPKADETVKLSYSHKEAGTLQIEGVCKITEDEISCWKTDQTRNEDLEAMVRRNLEDPNRYGSRVQILYGKKNRLVVAKSTQSSHFGPSASMSIESLGERQDSWSPIDLNTMSSFEPGKPYIRYETRMGSFDKSVTETSLRIRLSEPAPGPAQLNASVGATTVIDGNKITLLSIAKGSSDEPYGYRLPNQKTWRVTIRVEQKGKRPIGVYLSPGQANQPGATMVDANGQIVPREKVATEQKKQQEEMMKRGPGIIRSNYAPAQTMISRSLPNGSLEITMNIDPKQLKAFSVMGTYTKMIDVQGIPLDAK